MGCQKPDCVLLSRSSSIIIDFIKAMSDNEFNIDWLISAHGEFLQQFGFTKDRIITGYNSWKDNNPATSIRKYFCDLLRQASLYNIKNANTEQEFYTSKLQLDTRILEYATDLEEEVRNFLLGQTHFDKLMISRLTLPFKFDVQINSPDCCSYCAGKNKKVFSFEKILEKKYLPFARCKRENGCNCAYSIIPLYDDSGKLLQQDPL